MDKSRTLLTIIGAAVVSALVAPASVYAAAALTNAVITDPSTGAGARVDSAGRLTVAARPLPTTSPWSKWQRVSLVTPANAVRQAVKPLTTQTTGGIDLTTLTVSVSGAAASS